MARQTPDQREDQDELDEHTYEYAVTKILDNLEEGSEPMWAASIAFQRLETNEHRVTVGLGVIKSLMRVPLEGYVRNSNQALKASEAALEFWEFLQKKFSVDEAALDATAQKALLMARQITSTDLR